MDQCAASSIAILRIFTLTRLFFLFRLVSSYLHALYLLQSARLEQRSRLRHCACALPCPVLSCPVLSLLSASGSSICVCCAMPSRQQSWPPRDTRDTTDFGDLPTASNSSISLRKRLPTVVFYDRLQKSVARRKPHIPSPILNSFISLQTPLPC